MNPLKIGLIGLILFVLLAEISDISTVVSYFIQNYIGDIVLGEGLFIILCIMAIITINYLKYREDEIFDEPEELVDTKYTINKQKKKV